MDGKENSFHISYGGGMALCVYDYGKPLGFLLYQHDLGLEGVCCFGKVARIMMFAFYEEYRGKGLGNQLLERVCQKVKEAGADTVDVELGDCELSST